MWKSPDNMSGLKRGQTEDNKNVLSHLFSSFLFLTLTRQAETIGSNTQLRLQVFKAVVMSHLDTQRHDRDNRLGLEEPGLILDLDLSTLSFRTYRREGQWGGWGMRVGGDSLVPVRLRWMSQSCTSCFLGTQRFVNKAAWAQLRSLPSSNKSNHVLF